MNFKMRLRSRASGLECGVSTPLWIPILAALTLALAPATLSQQPPPLRDYRDYRDYALSHDGNPAHGRALFLDEAKAACVKCHSTDGSASKAGPDLQSAGDKLPRRDIVQSILEPSAAIAVGYGSTTIETKSGEEYLGVLKQMTDQFVELATADGKHVRIETKNIQSQRGSSISLMPENIHAGMTREDFTDLVEYIVSLKQPENSLTANRGMPSEIPELTHPVAVNPFFTEELRFPHAFVHKPGDVRSGLTYFAQAQGLSNAFLVVHQTGKIWLLEKNSSGDTKTIFGDFSSELFNERGPNGLLSIAFHPKYRQNGKYYLKLQVFEDNKIATTVVEKIAAPDRRHDSGKPSRRLIKIVATTQDHTGGYICFGPDGYLYIGMGDTGPQQDPQGHGQDLNLLLGKILRIDVDGGNPLSESDKGGTPLSERSRPAQSGPTSVTPDNERDLPYAIPSDNPFRNQPNARPEIFAYGFREPWRFSFDPVTGDLWVGDVGQDRVEEVAIVGKGENHGWNVFEGFEPFSNKYKKEGATYTPPVFAYRRKYGNSITGGYVYRGDKKSSFYGVYICGDYTSHRIWGITQENRQLKIVRQIATSPQNIASFATDEQGEIYVVGYEGMIYKLDFTTANFNEATSPTSH